MSFSELFSLRREKPNSENFEKIFQVVRRNKDDHVFKSAWRSIERSLRFPVDSNGSSLRNYNNFVVDLKARIGEYPKAQVPSDIREILDKETAPSVQQAVKLQQFIKARDTLVVWEKIAKVADIEENFSKAYASAEEAIKRAKGFADWMNKNSVQLFKKLYFLDLSLNQLTSIPQELGGLEDFVKLNISHNQLKSISKELGGLKNLMAFYLSHNQLKSIPKELGGLKNLFALDLNHNQLTSIPKELGGLKALVILDLSHNQLTSIPKELGGLENLMRFFLDGNPLKSIPEELGSFLENLPELDLSHNQLTLIPKELRQVPYLQL